MFLGKASNEDKHNTSRVEAFFPQSYLLKSDATENIHRIQSISAWGS